MEGEHEQAVADAAKALSRAAGQRVVLTDAFTLSDDKRRNLILRADATYADGRSRPVIVKATRDPAYQPGIVDAYEHGLVKEWISTAFLSDRAPGNGPLFLAGDADRGLIVLGDLGAGLGSLVRPLLDGPPDMAERGLIAYARAMGRLHADTLDCIARHGGYLRRDFPAAALKPPLGGQSWRTGVVAKVVTLLGHPPPEMEIATVAERMSEPGAWLALAHRDGCPDNVLLSESRAHLIDFEFAGPGHILLDAAYWRMGFPTCWCAGRLPAHVVGTMDRAYRDVLAPVLPLAADADCFHREMAIFLFVRMFASVSWLLERALEKDVEWGITTYRPRLLWHLDAAVDGADGVPTLAGLRATAARWRDDLTRLWPEAQPLPLYPAFRS